MRSRVGLILSMLAIAQGSCGAKPRSDRSATGGGATASDQALLDLKNAPDGLYLKLSEGRPGAGDAGRDRIPVRPATKLTAADVNALIARMPALVEQPDDSKNFALRERSQPPPRTGDTIKGKFPPGPSKLAPDVKVAGTELKVLRWMPEGEVPLAPHLSITFNQPMVAVTSHADTVAKAVPVKLSPTPPGKWRWLGTRTLMFDPEVRFPAATEYSIEIAEGTRSASGAVLAKTRKFSFATPPPTVNASFPSSHNGPQPLEPVMFVQFDQKIDPAKILDRIELQVGNDHTGVRQATAAEIAKDPVAKALVEGAEKSEQAGRYVVFRPNRPLPKGATVSVTIPAGTPSAEGPRKTTAPQSFSFYTFHPLAVVRSYCSWGQQCPPMTPWSIEFNNPLDEELFDQATIAIDPPLPGMRVTVAGNWMTIQGQSKGRTTYKVTLPASLRDRFEQSLGKPQNIKFQVGDADPQLFGQSGLVLLDPAARKRTFDIHSVNIKSLDVQVYKVAPRDWDAFARFMQKNPRRPRRPPGKKVYDKTIQVERHVDGIVETAIDLSGALDRDGLGHAVVLVEPTTWPDEWKPFIHSWVQSTRIGLDAFVDSTELIAWATRLGDGKPMAGVDLEVVPFGTKARTDRAGMAALPLSSATNPKDRSHLVVARSGNDVAFLPEHIYFWSDHGNWIRRDRGESLRWFVYDDRQMYRPGETIHLKGWLRKIDDREHGDIEPLAGAATQVSYVVSGPLGNEIHKGKARVSELGGFDLAFKLPRTPNLGHSTIRFTATGKGALNGREHYHNFQIQEFRRPEYEVTATASEGPHEIGGSADVTVKAEYYAGGGLPNAEVSWNVTSAPTVFTPPNRDEFTFGTWTPWWRYWYDEEAARATRSESFQGKTDAVGTHMLHIDFLSVKPPRPMSVMAQAWVTDVNRQSWAAGATLLVHPSDLYVGLRRDRFFVDQGTPIELGTIVVDHDGKAIAGRAVTVRATRLEWKYKNGEWKEDEVDPQLCETTSAKDPVDCKFETPEGGTYQITATVLDERGRPNQTEILYWVTGGKLPPAREVQQEQVQLVPDRKEYAPGQTARILVQSPFFPGQALITLRRSGITNTRLVEVTGPSTTIEVPIEERHIPNLYVQVDVVGSAERISDDGVPDPKLPRRPAYAVGTINLEVPPRSRTLAVTVTPRHKKIEPGGKTSIDVKVAGPGGKAVAGAGVSVIVVDESVLALSSYITPDPVPVFYSQRDPGATDYHQRQYVRLARPDAATLSAASGRGGDAVAQQPAPAAEAAPADEDRRSVDKAEPGGGGRAGPAKKPLAKNKDGGKRDGEAFGDSEGNNNTPIAVRTNFDPLAVFAPEVRTDGNGRARVSVKLPDNLTRYRVMAVAVTADKNFGKGESAITARMPLMVRPSPPRFLNFGDKFELPVVLQNQTDESMAVKVAVRATNADITDGQGRSIVIPANDRVEVRFPAAAEMPGTARFQIAASTERWADAAEFALPVWTPATTEAFATYGEIDKGAIRQAIEMPRGVVEEFGGLEITTSSTQLQALTDAFVYLITYPFECSEQTASRILAIAALRDVLGAFKAPGLPPPKEVEKIIERDLDRLRSLQNHDGGFAWWVLGYESWPYNSIHAAHALARARLKGYDVNAEMFNRSLGYLKVIEQHIPWWYPESVKRMLRAYALYVRRLGGEADTKKAHALLAEAGLDGLSIEALGWLMGTMTGDRSSATWLGKIHRHLDNKVSETAATAHWTTGYSDGNYLILHSDRRADGVILEALIQDKPRSDLIAKVVRGLLAHRKRGRWENTQENAFVLLAMDKYFATYEKVTPSFVARMWLGDGFAGEEKFHGRETKRFQVDVPMAFLARTKGRSQDLIIEKDGKGRLYFRIGMTYAPESLWLPPSDHGFVVTRSYEHVDNPKDVTRLKDGTWKVKAGARVRVRLTMVAEARRYHVALVDPLPAGLEPLNPALAVTGAIPQDPNEQKKGPYWWWYRSWYEHQNLRDERVEAFTTLLWEGVHEYTYVARATTPGKFVVPPTKAEEMYSPETFGRSSSDKLIVE